jgi:hypothetical protein
MGGFLFEQSTIIALSAILNHNEIINLWRIIICLRQHYWQQ